MYSTRDTEEKVFESKYLAPGIHKVKITEISGHAPEGRSPYLELKFANSEQKTAEVKFYMSEKAMPRSLEKLTHIGTKCVTRETMDSISADSLEDYGKKLENTLKGKVLRIKFTGEEIEGKEGKGNWWKANIGLPRFAEACKEGAEYEAVDDDNTALTFDESNNYDMKRLVVADVEEDTTGFSGGTSEADDDPF